MRPIRERFGGFAQARLAVGLGAIILFLGAGYVAGVHHPHDGEPGGHCAVCSLASAHVTPTADAPQASPSTPTCATVHLAPIPVAGRRAVACPSTRAPPSA